MNLGTPQMNLGTPQMNLGTPQMNLGIERTPTSEIVYFPTLVSQPKNKDTKNNYIGDNRVI